jgi:hypothetical protein
MPGNTSPDADFGPSAPSIDLKAVPGGGMDFTFIDATGAPAPGWSMSHSQALTLAARILGLLGYREVHLRDDRTISSAS